MDKPLVSVVITTHNRFELLKRAYESVEKQTYTNIEIIVISDNSNDGTNEWLTKKNINHIQISKEESKGGNYARNLGIKNTTGKYVAFLDDDDYWLPTKIEKQVNILEESNSGFIHTAIKQEIINKNNSLIFKDIIKDERYKGDLRKRILYQITSITSSIMVKRDILEKVGFFDEKCKFWQEYELSIRISQLTNFEYINEPLIVYRIDNSDKTRLTNKFHEWKDAVKYIYNKHKILYNNLTLSEKIKVKRLYYNDGKIRSENANLNSIKYKLYRFNIKIFNKLTTLILNND